MIFEHGSDDEEETPRMPVVVRRMKFSSQPAEVMFERAMVNRYRGNQLIHEKAVDIVFNWAKCAPKAKLCQAIAIGRWVQTHIRYVNEGVETFQSPVRTLTWRAGDCDDFATLICALLESIGIPSRLVALEWEGSFRHIVAQAIIDVPGQPKPREVFLDATLNEDVRKLPNPVAMAIARGRAVRTFSA